MLLQEQHKPATLPRLGHAFAKLFTQRSAALNCDSNVPIHLCSIIISSARPLSSHKPHQPLRKPSLAPRSSAGHASAPFPSPIHASKSRPSPMHLTPAHAPPTSPCTSHHHTSLRHVSYLSLTQPYYHHPFPYHNIPHHTAPRTPPLESLESSLSPSPLSSYTAWLRRPGQQNRRRDEVDSSTCRNRAGKSCPVSGSRAGKAADWGLGAGVRRAA